jgi:putative transposase
VVDSAKGPVGQAFQPGTRQEEPRLRKCQAGKPDLPIMKREYQRHLPHQIPEGFPVFLTWNLKGALPREIIDRLRRQRADLERQPKRVGESDADRRTRHGKILFAIADRYLDGATEGPLHLRDPAARKVVEQSITFGVPDRYRLFAWCVMANHVHVLLTPNWKLRKVTQGIKGYTARRINKIQNACGRVF